MSDTDTLPTRVEIFSFFIYFSTRHDTRRTSTDTLHPFSKPKENYEIRHAGRCEKKTPFVNRSRIWEGWEHAVVSNSWCLKKLAVDLGRGRWIRDERRQCRVLCEKWCFEARCRPWEGEMDQEEGLKLVGRRGGDEGNDEGNEKKYQRRMKKKLKE